MTNNDTTESTFNALGGATLLLALYPNDALTREAWVAAYDAHAELIMLDPALSLEDTNDAIDTLFEALPIDTRVDMRGALKFDY